jgi:Protein of unknown function (DUF3768)
MLQTQTPETTLPTPETANTRTERIRQFNDFFRMHGVPLCTSYGRKMMTRGIRALGAEAMVEIAEHVMAFNDFSEDNDPWCEHDFGAFDFKGEKVFWKIDYYDRCRHEHRSPDPSNASATCRVLTIMLASEY